MTAQGNDLLKYRIALAGIKGMNVTAARRLLDVLGSEEALFTMDQREVERLTGLNAGVFGPEVRDSLLERAAKETEFVGASQIRPLFFTDKDYPGRLLECDDAPVLLYALGNANLNARHVIGIVGTRNATAYGVNFINRLVEELSSRIEDLLVVSGLALGCDVAAHRQAMKSGVPTAGVLAHGLDMIYPPENRNDAARMVAAGGALLTDYPRGTRPYRGNFLARNRIVAGMVDCLVVAESAADHGGALHTARIAREYNREVFALPGSTSDHYSGGCNKLIRRQVALLCERADDIIEAMGWTPLPAEGGQPQLFPDLSPEEETVMEYLRREGEGELNPMSVRIGLPVGKLIGVLMKLEMQGLILTMPGSRYRPA